MIRESDEHNAENEATCRELVDTLKHSKTPVRLLLHRLGWRKVNLWQRGEDNDHHSGGSRDAYLKSGAGFAVKIMHRTDQWGQQNKQEAILFRRFKNTAISSYLAKVYWQGRIRNNDICIQEKLSFPQQDPSEDDVASLLQYVLETAEPPGLGRDKSGKLKANDYGY